MRALVFFSHELFQAPNAKRFVQREVFIACQIKCDVVLVDKLQVLCSWVWANAEHCNACRAETSVVFSQVARLSGASRRHVMGIEIKRKFLAGIIGECALASILKGRFKCGCRSSSGQGVGGYWHGQITVFFPSSSLVPLHNSSQFAK